jgi:hypothetical protein
VPDWVADQGFVTGGYGFTVGGGAYFSNEAVVGTADPILYQRYRMGSSLEYFFNVPNGYYQVTLHFCDFSSSSAGENVFSATIQGLLKLDHLDVFSASGGRARALSRQFDVSVNGGVLLLQLAQNQGQCFISGVEIEGLQQRNPLTIRLLEPFNAVRIP